MEISCCQLEKEFPLTACLCINCLMRWLSAIPRFLSMLFIRVIHEKICPALRRETKPSDHCLFQDDGSDDGI